MVAPSAPNKYPTRQGTIVAGQPSLVTMVITNADGTATEVQFYAPPGASVTVPPTFLTAADSLYFISATYGMGPNDSPGVGLHWNGNSLRPNFVYGPTGSYHYLDLLSINDWPTIMRVAGSNTNLCAQVFQTSCVDGQQVTFPRSFNNGQVFVTGSCMASTTVVLGSVGAPSPGYFTTSMTETTASGNSRVTSNKMMMVTAIGPCPF